MLIVLFGESCVGKSTLAEKLQERLNAKIYSGKDYLRLEKGEAAATLAFKRLLKEAVAGENIIYVVSEKEQLALVPDGAVRVLVTAELEVIKERFKARMHGNLPAPVAAMLEKKHGSFDSEPHELHIESEQTDAALERIMDKVSEWK